MRINQGILKSGEKATFQLRDLYQKYGYTQFKMGKFEEYELYVRNKDFISAENIIAFTDSRGKLMALKPDLTLSIVKNYHHTDGYVEKIYYSENIYRASNTAHTCKEILQTGLECLGDIDIINLCEVTLLAASSLKAISNDYVLEISHMGIISSLVHPIEDNIKEKIVKCIGEKNIHEIHQICHRNNIDENIYKSIETLVSTYGNYRKVLNTLRKLPLNKEGRQAVSELETICGVLAKAKMSKNISIDFSIVNDVSYYSGILYKGFIKGIPTSVLSGGQYDKLMTRMGKESGAIGFALYLDSLDRLDIKEDEFDVDVVFIYDEATDIDLIYENCRKIVDKGETVTVEKTVPDKLKYRRKIKLKGGEVVTIERND